MSGSFLPDKNIISLVKIGQFWILVNQLKVGQNNGVRLLTLEQEIHPFIDVGSSPKHQLYHKPMMLLVTHNLQQSRRRRQWYTFCFTSTPFHPNPLFYLFRCLGWDINYYVDSRSFMSKDLERFVYIWSKL